MVTSQKSDDNMKGKIQAVVKFTEGNEYAECSYKISDREYREEFNNPCIEKDGHKQVSGVKIAGFVVNELYQSLSMPVKIVGYDHKIDGVEHTFTFGVDYADMTPEFREILSDFGERKLVFLDPPCFDKAIVGLTQDEDGNDHVVYAYDALIEVVNQDLSVSIDDAVDFIEHNTIRALGYMGENKPIVITRVNPFALTENMEPSDEN